MGAPPIVRALQGLIKRVPFYQLSALSMLLGCYTLNNALALRPGQTGKLLLLLFVLNVYEALLIGLGLFLVQKRGLREDGRTLLLLEVLFLSDVTLLAGECFASSLSAGLLVTAAAFLLAVIKVVVVVRSLAPGAERGAFLSLGLPLLLVFATPGLFALLARAGLLSPVVVYLAWWVAALTVLILALEARQSAALAAAPLPPEAGAFRRALAYALPASLMLHLGATAWVYHIDFHWAHLGPVLLALGVGRMLVDVPWLAAVWQHRLVFGAVPFSLGAPEELIVHAPLGLTLSPLRAILAAVALGYLLTYPIHRSAVLALSAAACLVAGAAGHSVTAMAENVGWLLANLGEGGSGLIPRTATGWGVVAVIFAFVLLGLGALASLWKPKEAPSANEDPGARE
jgi:hypothetical protein